MSSDQPIMATRPSESTTPIVRLETATIRLAALVRQITEAHSNVVAALRARRLAGVSGCTHPDGHEIRLRPREAMSIEAARDCPCCGARLWIQVPSVSRLLESIGIEEDAPSAILEAGLGGLERRRVTVLRKAPYPLRSSQVAAILWSDESRTHDVRSLLYRVRRKLRGTGWTIPVPERGQGVRLLQVGESPSHSNRSVLHESVESNAA
jgi:hypothetical protein